MDSIRNIATFVLFQTYKKEEEICSLRKLGQMGLLGTRMIGQDAL